MLSGQSKSWLYFFFFFSEVRFSRLKEASDGKDKAKGLAYLEDLMLREERQG